MTKNGYILSIDQGTTSSRAALISEDGNIISQKNIEFKQYFPNNGWVEHDPRDILSSTIDCIKYVINESKVKPEDIMTAGVTNQRETIVVWDKISGDPVYNAIVWQDRRTEDICESLREKNVEDLIQKKTGLLIDPYFSASKIKWILENVDRAKSLMVDNNLLIGTIDTWLIWNLSNKRYHLTDVTNASRTMIYNIIDDCWDEDLLKLFNIPREILPEVKNSMDNFGVISKDFFGSEIPITGVAGDQQAAAFGQLCIKKGMIKSTYGTGCFMLMNTGTEVYRSQNKLLSTTAFKISNQKMYALEGSIFNAGTIVQWMRDELSFFEKAGEIETLASNAKNDITFIPAFTGLGAPYWRSDIRGSIHGITRDTSKSDLALAALKSVCFQSKDLYLSLQKDMAGEDLNSVIRVDGGMSQNNLMMQYLADLLQINVERPVIQETTVMGAAYLAGLQHGIYKSIDDLKELWKTDRVFEPSSKNKKINDDYGRWIEIIKREIK
jgi:glycerol kinase